MQIENNSTKNGCVNTIPKIIHYVWMGGAAKPELALRCIASWKKYMPDYDIIEWNETNFDVNIIDYVREAYEQKKWAFVSDAVRTYVLKEYGGIYFDTDVELFSGPDGIFENAGVVVGFDTKLLLSTGVLATMPQHPIFQQLWEIYKTSHFRNVNEESTINTKLTFIVIDYIGKRRLVDGTYYLKNVKIYPSEYFSDSKPLDRTPVFALHHFVGSWKTRVQLTFFQYIVFRVLIICLGILSRIAGNKGYLKVNDAFWRNTWRISERNLEKGVKIYKAL